ncbi:hypothetical protein ACT7DA_09945 [Bacillus pacificus]
MSEERHRYIMLKNMTKYCGGAKIYLKREDLKPYRSSIKLIIQSVRHYLQCEWARKKLSLKQELDNTGVATATVCALLGLECVIFMGEEDVRRQKLNVFRMELLERK